MTPIIELFEQYNGNSHFIDLGCFMGEGINMALLAGYRHIIGLEEDKKYYEFCKNRFKHFANVEIILMDKNSLRRVLSGIRGTITFWLDIRYGQGVEEAINDIREHENRNHVILVENMTGNRVKEAEGLIQDMNPYYEFSLKDGFTPNDILVAKTKDVMNVNIIIFSKDRACQLDLLLRSMWSHIDSFDLYHIKVLYTYSNSLFYEGYRELIEREEFPSVFFKHETNFKDDVS